MWDVYAKVHKFFVAIKLSMFVSENTGEFLKEIPKCKIVIGGSDCHFHINQSVITKVVLDYF